jgi:flagellar basal body-associated protein FliL
VLVVMNDDHGDMEVMIVVLMVVIVLMIAVIVVAMTWL